MSDGSLVPRQREEAIVSYGPKRRQEVGYIALANGESDTWYHAIPALGIPGANQAKTIQPEYLEGTSRIYAVGKRRDQKFVSKVGGQG